MKKSWLIRISSDPARGAGHLSRSGALALAFARSGQSVTAVLDRGGMPWPARYRHDEIDVTETTDIYARDWNGSVLDSYALGQRETKVIAASARPVIVMDDFLKPPDYADMVINPAIHLHGDSVDGTIAMLGPSFACIDPSFAEFTWRPVRSEVEIVLVTFGAIDPDNATGQVLSALALLGEEGFSPRVDVVMGVQARHLEDVRKAVENLGDRARLVIDAPDMTSLMHSADLIVGSGGVSMMERLAMGIPSVTIQIAENQRLSIEGAVQKGATVISSAGDTMSLAATILELASDRRVKRSLAAAGRKLVDGNGAERVAARLMTFARIFHMSGAKTH